MEKPTSDGCLHCESGLLQLDDGRLVQHITLSGLPANFKPDHFTAALCGFLNFYFTGPDDADKPAH